MQVEFELPTVATMTRPRPERATAVGRRYHGDGRDVLLQGFHWDSHHGGVDSRGGKRSWYRIVRENARHIRAAGFTWVWMPPPSDSLAPQGYIPRRWHLFDSALGREAELRAARRALAPVRAMADIVLNHRVGIHTAGADFDDPPFADNRAAIVCDDASGVGTGNPDTGEHHPAGRDLDHANPGVRAAVEEYLGRLKALGFQGWRYDLVKGFHGRFIGAYNDASRPGLSVGEFFDGDPHKAVDWLSSTGGRSTAFDFSTRFLLYDACGQDDFSRLCDADGRPAGLVGLWPSRAVTFLDNHDTEYRREQDHQYDGYGIHHFPGTHVDMGYAYLLTHPGVPCVFWSHFFDWGEPTRRRIERLIRVREQAGLHARSWVEVREADYGLYAAVIDDRVAVKLGSRHWSPGFGWHLAVDGDRLAVWTR